LQGDFHCYSQQPQRAQLRRVPMFEKIREG
jgi:hypothetical protein